jgi:hypothetical protein
MKVGKCVVFMGPGGGVIKALPGVATWLLLLSLDDATPASPRYFFVLFLVVN